MDACIIVQLASAYVFKRNSLILMRQRGMGIHVAQLQRQIIVVSAFIYFTLDVIFSFNVKVFEDATQIWCQDG